MTKEIMRIPREVMGMCTKCGFYDQCPIEYLCPAAVIVVKAIQEVNEDEDD